MAINVTGNIANIAVNSTSNVVTVSSSPVNVQLSATSVVSNASVRQAISVSNVSGFGNLSYDSSNTSNGVIQYVGTSTSDIRGSISNTAPITYNSSTGVIGLEQTLDDLTLKKYQETIVSNGNSSGNITLDVASGTIQKYTLTGNVTAITPSNLSTGGSATLILTQDSTGGHVLDTTTFPLEWVQWDFVNDFTSLDTTANAFNIVNILYDGSKYYASLTTDSEIIPDSLTVTGNISAGNISTSGQLDVTGNINGGQVALTGEFTSNSNITTTANIEAVTLKGTGALGLVVNGNATIGGNLDVTGNINSETVVDLFVEDRNITMQYGAVGAPSANSQIFIDRGTSANTYIKWDESTDKWKFSNDGTTEYAIPASTDDLAEGSTNLYFTNARANAAFATNTTDNLTQGTTNLYFANSLVDDYITGGNGINYGAGTITLDVAYTRNQFSAAGDLSYNASTGVFSFTNDAGDIESVTAGDGLTGGGTTGNVTLDVGAGYGITVSADAVAVTNAEIQAQANIAIGNNTTDNLSEGSTNLYYTQSRFDTAFSGKSTSDLSEGTNLYYTNARANAAFVDSLDNITTEISSTANITTTANVAGSYFIGNVSGTTAEFTGNITAGNIIANSVIDTTANITTTGNITGGYIIAGNDAGADGIFIGDINGAIQQEVNNNSGVTLARGAAVYLTGGVQGDTPNVALANAENAAQMPAIGIVKNNIADGTKGEIVTGGQLNIGTHGFTVGSQLYINGAGLLTETIPLGESNLVQKIGKVVNTQQIIVQGAGRTNATPNLDEGNIFLGSTSGTAISVAPDSNFDTTGNVFSLSNTLTDVNSITSEGSANLNLKGQANGIHLDKTVDSTESRILDINTDGYRITSADAGSANIASYTGGVKGILIAGTVTAGSPTMTTFPPAFAGLPGYGFGDNLGGQSGSTTYLDLATGQTIEAAFANASALGGVQNGEGWILFNAAGGGFLTNFDRDTHVSSISGNTLTLNKNAIASATTVFIMFPAVASSTQEGLSFLVDYTVGSYNFEGLQPYTQNYVLPETLSNVTIDRTCVSDDFDLANVKLGHIADLNVGDNDYIRVDRGLLIGGKAEPDPFSSRNSQSSPSGASVLGLTLEHDGETEYAANNTPQVKFLINNYTANSILGMASTPNWASDFGSTNVTVDNQYLSSPMFNFKSINSSKEAANGRILANTVVGSIVWNAPTNTTALDTVGTEVGLNTGSDLIHPPAGIKVRMASDQAQTSNTTAMDMYVQTSYRTSYRDGTTDAKGSIPRTFLANKEGNTIIAAKTDGRIALKPVRDYGDSGNAATFTENRYAHELHEYHTFLDASFANTTAKTGTIVTIQPDSGETGGSTDFNYDSKGNATLRFQTHLANNDPRYNYDLIHDEANENFIVASNNGGKEHISINQAGRVSLKQVMALHPLSNSAILALTSNTPGDVVYGSDVNKVCYYNGSSWKTIDDNTDIV